MTLIFKYAEKRLAKITINNLCRTLPFNRHYFHIKHIKEY